MEFVRRDFVLLAATVFFILGLTPFMPLAYSIAIGTAIFFGLKYFVIKKRQKILKESGKGVCVECGSAIKNDKCPKCDV